MMKNLVIFSHTYFDKSNVNKALLDSLKDTPNLEVRNLNAKYPDGKIDVAAELSALKSAQNIYFQFPLFWFSTPSLLKEWQDSVLTAILYGENPKMLEGKKFGVIVTIGSTEDKYKEMGGLDKFLVPLVTSFSYLGATSLPTHGIYGAHHIEDMDSVIKKYQAIFA